jgi:hypothetical protein
MLRIPKTRQIRIPFHFVAIVLLAGTAYILHKSALSGYWRYDDGLHLAFAARYSPWQYFFIPEITSLQSGGKFFTPWNAFFYDINLWLFRLNAEGFYAHQLTVLWLSSVVTFIFLRLWVGPGWALFGAVLFLSNASTAVIAQELMTGHYAAGLLFSIIALCAYVLSIRKRHWPSALIGSFFYLLALLCKEIYFPLIGILPFLPEGELRSRLRFSIPYGMIALGYIPWRFIVLNAGVGGYDPEFLTNLSLNEIGQMIKAFFHLPQILLGGGTVTYAILLIISIAYFFKNLNKLPILIVGLFLLLAPLVPMWRSIGNITRLDFLFWWSLSIYFAILLSTWEKPRPLRYLLAIFILVLSLQTWYTEMYSSDGSKPVRDCHDAASRFVLNSTSQQVLYDSLNVWYPASIVVGPLVEVEKKIYPSSPRRAFITPEIGLLDSFLLKKATIWEYNDQCRCIENITSRVPSLIIEYRKKQFEKPLFLHMKYEQNTISWEVGPYNDGIYELIITNNSYSSGITLPGIKGATVSDAAPKLEFYLRYKSPDGWITRSPIFHYVPASDPVLTWSRQ